MENNGRIEAEPRKGEGPGRREPAESRDLTLGPAPQMSEASCVTEKYSVMERHACTLMSG
jgi:hypothetical protein